MISFELAKALREAGFPQEQGDGCYYWYKVANGKGAYHGPWFAAHQDGEIGFIPDLDSLIDACGDGFKTLERRYSLPVFGTEAKLYWKVKGSKNGFGMARDAATSAEAVAKLFIALKEAK